MAAAANWPQFRGPPASGAGTGSPPTEWNVESGKNILWKTVIPGLGHSSPVIWGARIFLTSAVPATGEAAFEVGSGKKLWLTSRSDVPTFSTPTVAPYTARDAKGWQVVVNGWKHVGDYDLKTGKELA